MYVPERSQIIDLRPVRQLSAAARVDHPLVCRIFACRTLYVPERSQILDLRPVWQLFAAARVDRLLVGQIDQPLFGPAVPKKSVTRLRVET